MATLRQKTAFNKTLETLRKPEGKTMGSILLEAGYSKAISTTPSAITNSKGWQELLSEINDDSLLKRLRDMALDKADKRASLQAIDMLLDLKGKYPNQKNETDYIDTIKKLAA